MEKSVIEEWLIDNDVPYFKGVCGSISINRSDVPEHLLSEYHELSYNYGKGKRI